MLRWLVGNCDVFGFTAQNWMLVVAAALLLYAVSLLLLARRHRAGPV